MTKIQARATLALLVILLFGGLSFVPANDPIIPGTPLSVEFAIVIGLIVAIGVFCIGGAVLLVYLWEKAFAA